jgi:hypothetical protein
MAPTRTRGVAAPAPEINGTGEPGIELDAGAGAEGSIIVEGELPANGATADDGVEELRRQLQEQQQAREAAERERDQLRQARQQDQHEIADSRLLVIDSAITTKEGELAAIKGKLQTAMEAGDYTAQVDAQAELAQVTLDLKQARQGKARLENEIEEGKSNATADPLEKLIADNNMHPKAAGWLRSHRSYFDDGALNKKLMQANFYALGEGAELNSERYFELLETKLGLRGGGEVQQEQQFEQQPARQASIPSAPVTRSAPQSTVGAEIYPGVVHLGGDKYKVSQAVREIAEASGITVKQYIENAQKLQRGPDGQMH